LISSFIPKGLNTSFLVIVRSLIESNDTFVEIYITSLLLGGKILGHFSNLALIEYCVLGKLAVIVSSDLG
tara:strand:- start:466 stop:675 length:210 start_codon:yes stop_codon:yes gene_type:complete